MPIYFWKCKMSCRHKCKSSQRWSSVCRTNPRAEHWRGKVLLSGNTFQYFFWKETQIQNPFFLPVSKAQDLYSTASAETHPILLRGNPLFYSKCISSLSMFLGLALQFHVLDNLIAQLPLNAIFTTEVAAQSHRQGDIAHRAAVTIRIPPRKSSHPSGLHFQPWVTLTDCWSVYLFCSKPPSPGSHIVLSPHFSPSVTSLFRFLPDADTWVWWFSTSNCDNELASFVAQL